MSGNDCLCRWHQPYATLNFDTVEDLRKFLDSAEPEWVRPETEKPNTDEYVLTIIDSKYENTSFEHAFELAEYLGDEGWRLEAYPDYTDFKVLAWMRLPRLPKWVEDKDA